MNIHFKFSGNILFLTASLIMGSCNNNPKTITGKDGIKQEEVFYKVTFIELGSVRCIPCQQIQPVMKSIAQKYKNHVKVIFYDMWTQAGAPFA